MPSQVVVANPFIARHADRRGVAQFGADRPEIAIPVAIDSSSCLNRYVLSSRLATLHHFSNFVEDRRLASGDDDMITGKRIDPIEDAGNRKGVPLGLPRCVACVAEPTSQIAAARPDKDARGSRELSLALDAMKNLRNPDHFNTT